MYLICHEFTVDIVVGRIYNIRHLFYSHLKFRVNTGGLQIHCWQRFAVMCYGFTIAAFILKPFELLQQCGQPQWIRTVSQCLTHEDRSWILKLSKRFRFFNEWYTICCVVYRL